MTAEPNSHARPAQPRDYDAIAAVINTWWGRPVLGSLPRVFFDLFHRTSLVVDGATGPDAFLVGILSPSDPWQAYIHFVGVAPDARQRGLARALYEQFFAMARADSRREVGAITAPVNTGSIAFHESMGFTVTGPVPAYNGPGADMMLFRRPL
ncbi:MAG TPA: GNAT family N-acetyltransferase [Streptosporangiaceae bacterium]|jgi:ribosomal protein S18 acetylase RimI-like enzyme